MSVETEASDPVLLDGFGRPGGRRWDGAIERGAGCFPDGRPAAIATGRIQTEDLPRDWRGRASLQFTVYNPNVRPLLGGVVIWDGAADKSPDLEYGDFVNRGGLIIFGEGITHVVVHIDPIQTGLGTRMLDLSDVVRLALNLPKPAEGEQQLSIADLRLSTARGGPDSSAAARPGDSVVIIEHLDQHCTTYKPDEYVAPEDVRRLEADLRCARQGLGQMVLAADMQGKQAYDARIGLFIADAALVARPLCAWHHGPQARRRDLTAALQLAEREAHRLRSLLSGGSFEDDEDDSNVATPIVPPMPDLRRLRIDGKRFIDAAGRPVLICAMSYHNEGELLRYFAPEQHKAEIFAVGGGSRYDIELSPVYEAFHKHEGTARVGFRGWCGHLIKDQWAMGGRKENVVICLENERILRAIREYNRLHVHEWIALPHLVYVILAYELTYMCYCAESLRRFRAWLRERHGTITALNECWGTAYRDFDEAAPPPCEGGRPAANANRAAWFDWTDWNCRRFTDHLKWSKADIRAHEPERPLCAGGSHSMLSPGLSTTGIDEELIINEVDDVILHEGNNLLGVDLFHALADQPKPLVDPEQGGECGRWLPNYLHGKAAISKFWWPRQPSRQFPRSTMRSPIHGTMPLTETARHLRIALEVRRLGAEITAFWDVPAEVAILYSRTTMMQVPPQLLSANTTPFLQTLRKTYDAARCLDAAITFTSERKLRDGRGMADGRAGQSGQEVRHKLLILPAVDHLAGDSVGALERFVQEGGTALLLPEALLADEYDRPLDLLSRWGIDLTDRQVPKIAGMGELEQGYDQNLSRRVTFGQGRTCDAASRHESLGALPVRTEGVFWALRAESDWETLAATTEGSPLLLRRRLGKGEVWLFAADPVAETLHGLLDLLYARCGIDRPLRVTDAGGNRVPGLEARLARQRNEDLVYLINDSGDDVSFRITTDRPAHQVRELRSLEWWPGAQGNIPAGETLIFSLKEDPAVRLIGEIRR